MKSNKTVVSAPGKVLLAGGYLILEQENEGFVLTLSARMVCIVEDRERKGEYAEIRVCCKQFKQLDYFFRVIFGENGEILEVQENNGSRNSHIYYALIYSLFYCNPYNMQDLYITILADNDYYSQIEPRSGLCRYKKFDFPIEKVHKTGIGSSSALMTSMIAALVVHLSEGKIDIEQTQNKWIIHNLSQIAHCSVQEKIGSGFDIAAACFGSCLYRRFDPAIIDSVGEHTSSQFKKQLTKVVESLWDISIEELDFPPGLGVILVDRNEGTTTSNMARNVMEWKNKDIEANSIWEELKKMNNLFYKTLNEMTNASRQFTSDYYEVLKISGQVSWDEDKMKFEDKTKQFIYDILYNLYFQLKSIREQLKIIGIKSNVPIEPSSQTLLLDKCSKIPGVLGVGIPGAGGYDAIFCIVIQQSNAKKDISSIKLDDTDLSILLSKEEHSGLKVENIHEFDFFLD
ncbi:phosphomevalonate kinase [Pneumocystis carinii B80]|uniref:Phosphomevalonate kinase n=1 Tax=Pneumocystis carinii (strain B80) TaxID=1408658 RepID=A0A0W4ZCK0_PNEC8|nr:phosphomevalonate kinase [Pneumocystis carinii B80]KTW26125.1 phosphomevalonate kinase [Pneumocystis carinii B80]